MNEIEQLNEIIKKSKNIVFLTGAGISTASGIPDIRGKNGAMNNPALIKKYKYSYEEIVSNSFFRNKTKEFFEYYKNEMIFPNAKPNLVHEFLAKLDNTKNVTIITQNIDGLHHFAGSKNIIEFHGSIYSNTCMKCGEKYPLNFIMKSKDIPLCTKCGGIIKPDVVLFEESIDYNNISNAVKLTEQADTLIVIGSSLTVYPAAGIPNYFNGKNFVIINDKETPLDTYATLVIHDDIKSVFSKLNVF